MAAIILILKNTFGLDLWPLWIIHLMKGFLSAWTTTLSIVYPTECLHQKYIDRICCNSNLEANEQYACVIGKYKIACDGVIYQVIGNDLDFPVLEYIHKCMAISRNTRTLVLTWLLGKFSTACYTKWYTPGWHLIKSFSSLNL